MVVPRKIETDQGDRDHYPLTGECTAEAGSNVHLFGQESNGRSSTGIYPIMFRGINRQTIFEDEQDKRKTLKGSTGRGLKNC